MTNHYALIISSHTHNSQELKSTIGATYLQPDFEVPKKISGAVNTKLEDRPQIIECPTWFSNRESTYDGRQMYGIK